MWDPSNEAFGVTDPGGLKGAPARVQQAAGAMMMDIVRGEHRDPAMAMGMPLESTFFWVNLTSLHAYEDRRYWSNHFAVDGPG